MFQEAAAVREHLKQEGHSSSLINARFVKPLDEALIDRLSKNHRMIAVIEENVPSGAFGDRVLRYVAEKGLGVHVLPLSLPDIYVEHGNVDILRKVTGLDQESMTSRILETYKEL